MKRRTISAREAMESWNLKHPDCPCTLKEVEKYFEDYEFIASTPLFAVDHMEKNGFNGYKDENR